VVNGGSFDGARVNQHPPAHQVGWMMDDDGMWTETRHHHKHTGPANRQDVVHLPTVSTL
jgi:hypothetical protein